MTAAAKTAPAAVPASAPSTATPALHFAGMGAVAGLIAMSVMTLATAIAVRIVAMVGAATLMLAMISAIVRR
jgi:hypothetical protein